MRYKIKIGKRYKVLPENILREKLKHHYWDGRYHSSIGLLFNPTMFNFCNTYVTISEEYSKNDEYYAVGNDWIWSAEFLDLGRQEEKLKIV